MRVSIQEQRGLVIKRGDKVAIPFPNYVEYGYARDTVKARLEYDPKTERTQIKAEVKVCMCSSPDLDHNKWSVFLHTPKEFLT